MSCLLRQANEFTTLVDIIMLLMAICLIKSIFNLFSVVMKETTLNQCPALLTKIRMIEYGTAAVPLKVNMSQNPQDVKI